MRIKRGFKQEQRHCYSDKGMISLLDPVYYTMNQYEIMPIDGLEDIEFEDVERFDTEEEALARCKELLG
jgi:hypothetical protein